MRAGEAQPQCRPSTSSRTNFTPKYATAKNAEAAQGPAHGRAAAPAEANAADQQHAEQHPGDERQHGLLHQVLREQIGDEDESGEQRQRQQAEARADQPEHDFFERIERRQDARQIGNAPRAQAPVEKHQQQRP